MTLRASCLAIALCAALALPALADDVWVVVSGRFVGDPVNPNYQEPLIEGYTEVGGLIASYSRDDLDRAIAIGPDGLIYAVRSWIDDEAVIRVIDPATGDELDEFGSWNGIPSDIEFGPQGTLFVQLAARFFGEPGNPLYQQPQLEEWAVAVDPGTPGEIPAMHLDTWPRADDRERQIAVGPNGDVYAGISASDPADATIRVYAAADRGTLADTFGAWNNGPSDIEIDAAGNLWIQIPGRFIGNPMHEQFQDNQLDVYDPLTGTELDSFVRADDRDRALAIGPTGAIFTGASLLNDEAVLRNYSRLDPGMLVDTIGSWKAGQRAITSTFVPEPGAAASAAAALLALAYGAVRDARRSQTIAS